MHATDKNTVVRILLLFSGSSLGRFFAPGSAAGNDLATFDQHFVWNEYIIRSLLDFRERLDPKERGELDKSQFTVRSFYNRETYIKSAP